MPMGIAGRPAELGTQLAVLRVGRGSGLGPLPAAAYEADPVSGDLEQPK